MKCSTVTTILTLLGCSIAIPAAFDNYPFPSSSSPAFSGFPPCNLPGSSGFATSSSSDIAQSSSVLSESSLKKRQMDFGSESESESEPAFPTPPSFATPPSSYNILQPSGGPCDSDGDASFGKNKMGSGLGAGAGFGSAFPSAFPTPTPSSGFGMPFPSRFPNIGLGQGMSSAFPMPSGGFKDDGRL